jgi:hypothetical protein
MGMGMLDRYRKPGGFLQLLNLIETSGPQKQEKFISLIREEDPRWAEALVQKTLSMQKIMSWEETALMEITAYIQEIVLATALHGLEEEPREKLLKSMSGPQRRNVSEAFKTSKPSAAEISTVFARMITDVRKMISDGRIRIEKVDPTLVIDDNIEENLKKVAVEASDNVVPISTKTEPPTVAQQAARANSATANISDATLKAKVQALLSENAKLREEVAVLRGKLEHIKKIA